MALSSTTSSVFLQWMMPFSLSENRGTQQWHYLKIPRYDHLER
jgi:hypothetical protein